DQNQVWYLAYGSNMNEMVLSGRRSVYPSKSIEVVVPGYYLNFNLKGFPYFEPCFASIGKTPIMEDQPTLRGILHLITTAEYDQIRKTEGGGGYADLGYQNLTVDCHTINGTIIHAHTLIAIESKNPLPEQFFPSERYMTLLEVGALNHDMDATYQSWLKSLPRYKTIYSPKHLIGKFLFGTISIFPFIPIAIVVAPIYLFTRRVPRFVYEFADWNGRFTVAMYYHIFRPIFGNGVGNILFNKKED
ncbi:hypothetical protein BC833DRAFT_530397, partial [Globomyces pollinis-pini]